MLPRLITSIPGPKSKRLALQLAKVESPNVTFLGAPGPIFWKKALDCNVWDADGNRYLDLTSAFGVASLGHTHRTVQAALQRQGSELFHAMGDVHPTELKVRLLAELSKITFERWTGGRVRGQTVLGNSGFEAVEAALKTALLKTNRSRIVGFQGGYHGVGFGALQATWREDFRRPFSAQLRKLTTFLRYPRADTDLPGLKKRVLALLKSRRFGAVLVEPVQGRGGIVVPPAAFLPLLRQACDETGTLLIVDEIFTGFWRTGKMFAVEHSGVVPDLICLGKALTGALPLSACIGKTSVMRAWPKTRGESIHTTTFLGNPLACAAALASIETWKLPHWKKLLTRSHEVLWNLLEGADGGIRQFNGIGMMFGIRLKAGAAVRACESLLQHGIIALPEGDKGEVLAITPPLCISKEDLKFAVEQIRDTLDEID